MLAGGLFIAVGTPRQAETRALEILGDPRRLENILLGLIYVASTPNFSVPAMPRLRKCWPIRGEEQCPEARKTTSSFFISTSPTRHNWSEAFLASGRVCLRSAGDDTRSNEIDSYISSVFNFEASGRRKGNFTFQRQF